MADPLAPANVIAYRAGEACIGLKEDVGLNKHQHDDANVAGNEGQRRGPQSGPRPISIWIKLAMVPPKMPVSPKARRPHNNFSL